MHQKSDVTLVVLVYRSLKWLDWLQKGAKEALGRTKYRWLVVANDATEEIRRDPRVDIDFRNDDPSEFYINRVYRAWNEGVIQAPTSLVCMLNSDMFPSPGWLDQLMVTKQRNPWTVPTSLLVESGRLPSAMPEYVRNFGRNPDGFDEQGFLNHAAQVRKYDKLEDGRLYMPILVDREEFIDVGMYPEGNPPGTTGDKDLIARYADAGFKHVTCLGSVVYHCQLGEQEWP